MLPKALKRRKELAGAGAGRLTVVSEPLWMLATPLGRSMVNGSEGVIATFDQWKVLGPHVPSKPQDLLGLYERCAHITTAWLKGRFMFSSIHDASRAAPCITNFVCCWERSSWNVDRVLALTPPAASS